MPQAGHRCAGCGLIMAVTVLLGWSAEAARSYHLLLVKVHLLLMQVLLFSTLASVPNDLSIKITAAKIVAIAAAIPKYLVRLCGKPFPGFA